MKHLLTVVAILVLGSTSFAAPASTPKKPRHALVKVAHIAVAPIVHLPAAAKFFGKATLETVMFGAEVGVDAVHGGLFMADKAFEAVSLQGKFPVLDSIYSFVDVADKDTGKLDSWLERQEMGLFGKSN